MPPAPGSVSGQFLAEQPARRAQAGQQGIRSDMRVAKQALEPTDVNLKSDPHQACPVGGRCRSERVIALSDESTSSRARAPLAAGGA